MPLEPYVVPEHISNTTSIEYHADVSETLSTQSKDKFLDAKDKDSIVSNNVEQQQSVQSSPGVMNSAVSAYQEWYQRERTPQEKKFRKIGWIIFGSAALITAFGVLIASLKKVEETSFGVQYNRHRKQLDDATKSGGLFIGPPGYKFIKFPSTFIGVDFNERTCVSRDGLRVVFSVTFQYQMIEENVIPAIEKYRDFYGWADIVEAAGLSAIHHSCGDYGITDFQNKRGEIQANMEENLRLKLEGGSVNETESEGVYAQVVSLQLQNIGLPDEYNIAVQEKQSAEEDIALARNERNQETTKARTALLSAEEEAKKILDGANNEAAVLLTEARLKAEEITFSYGKEAERIVDVKTALGLNSEGVLAYLYTTLLSEVDHLKITTGEPARLSRSGEL